MSDSRLQELRRAWEASESVEDEAAYLRERVRAGELKPSAVELAAYAGHPAAERAAGQAASTAERAYAFCRGLLRWGPKPIAVALRGVLLFFEPDDEAGHEASARALEWFHSELELPDIGWFIPEVQGGLRRTREGSDLARTAFSLMSELTRPFYVDPELPEIRRASERSNWTASGQPTDWAYAFSCLRGAGTGYWVHRFQSPTRRDVDLVHAAKGWEPPSATRTAPEPGELTTLDTLRLVELKRTLSTLEREHSPAVVLGQLQWGVISAALEDA